MGVLNEWRAILGQGACGEAMTLPLGGGLRGVKI
jgi:hypothetical protein